MMRRRISAIAAAIALMFGTFLVVSTSAQATPDTYFKYGINLSGYVRQPTSGFVLQDTFGGVTSTLQFQSDCNFVEYSNAGGTNHAVWVNPNPNNFVCHTDINSIHEELHLQKSDGNIVIYEMDGPNVCTACGNNGVVWASGFRGATWNGSNLDYYELVAGSCTDGSRYAQLGVLVGGGYKSGSYPFGASGC
jgi:hypothetical protein